MVIEMMQDMALWTMLNVVFMVACAGWDRSPKTAPHGHAPSALSVLDSTRDGRFMVTFYSICTTDNMTDVLQVPIWAMYGEFEPDVLFEWSPM
eukprot:3808270-Prymnesium_polylepis.1